MANSIDALQADFDALKAKREAINAKTAGLKAQREKVMAREQELRIEALKLTDEINAIYANENFMAVSKRLGAIANAIMELKNTSLREAV